jgi:hypothetical protein
MNVGLIASDGQAMTWHGICRVIWRHDPRYRVSAEGFS